MQIEDKPYGMAKHIYKDTISWFIIKPAIPVCCFKRPHYKKNICKVLLNANVKVYLPLQTSIRNWNDWKGRVSRLLFHCRFIVCNIILKTYYAVLKIPEKVQYISNKWTAIIAMPCIKIQLIQSIFPQDIETEIPPQAIHKGIKTEIQGEPLKDVAVKLIEYTNRNKPFLRIKEVFMDFLANVPRDSLQVIG